MMDEGRLYDQVVGRTMKTSHIQLGGFPMIQRQVSVLVMCDKIMYSDLRSDAQRK